jgi:hypothetical protein
MTECEREKNEQEKRCRLHERSIPGERWSRLSDSNRRPADYKSARSVSLSDIRCHAMSL